MKSFLSVMLLSLEKSAASFCGDDEFAGDSLHFHSFVNVAISDSSQYEKPAFQNQNLLLLPNPNHFFPLDNSNPVLRKKVIEHFLKVQILNLLFSKFDVSYLGAKDLTSLGVLLEVAECLNKICGKPETFLYINSLTNPLVVGTLMEKVDIVFLESEKELSLVKNLNLKNSPIYRKNDENNTCDERAILKMLEQSKGVL